MTLANIWSSILLLAALGAVMLGSGIVLKCTKRKWKLKRAVVEMMNTTGTLLVIIAFYASIIVATTELVVTVTRLLDK